ncbi:MAG: O-antigen polymerase [Candidatus Acidiferrales bacterium]
MCSAPTTRPRISWTRANLSPWILPILLSIAACTILLLAQILYASLDARQWGGTLLLLFAGLAAWPIIRDIRNRTFDPLEVRNMFLCFYALYVLTLPLLSFLAGQSASPNVSMRAIWYALFLCTLALPCFFQGYKIPWGDTLARRLRWPPRESVARLRKVTLFIVAGAGIWFCLLLISVGGIGNYVNAGYSGMYQIEQGKEHLAFSIATFPTCVLLLYHLAHRAKLMRMWILFGAASLAVAGLLMAIGHRRLMITTVLGLLVYHHYAVRRISGKRLFVLSLLLAFGFSLIGLIRLLPNKMSSEAVAVLRDQSPAELFYAYLDQGEAAPIFESFPLLIEEISHGMPHEWGRTYLLAPAILVPHVLYPGRPPTPAEWYTAEFFPDIAAQLGGRGLFFLAEAYWNFGFMGPLALMFGVGVGCRFLHSLLKQQRFDSRAVLLYATAISWIPSAIRIDFATSFKASVGSSLPLVLLVIWYGGSRRLVANPEGVR